MIDVLCFYAITDEDYECEIQIRKTHTNVWKHDKPFHPLSCLLDKLINIRWP